jgi:hypothetical protein
MVAAETVALLDAAAGFVVGLALGGVFCWAMADWQTQVNAHITTKRCFIKKLIF